MPLPAPVTAAHLPSRRKECESFFRGPPRKRIAASLFLYGLLHPGGNHGDILKQHSSDSALIISSWDASLITVGLPSNYLLSRFTELIDAEFHNITGFEVLRRLHAQSDAGGRSSADNVAGQ